MANKKTVPFIAKCSGNCGGCRGAGTGPDCPETDEGAEDTSVPTVSLPLMSARSITIFEVITGKTLERVTKELDQLLSQGDDPILVRLSTEGGSVSAAITIYELLTTAGPQIVVAVMGNAFSAGSLILQAGDVRLVTPNAGVMTHQGSGRGEIEVNLENIRAIESGLRWEEERWDRAVANRTGRPLEEIQRWSKETKFMTSVEAIELGFADAVLLPREVDDSGPAPQPSFLDRAKERVASAIEDVRSFAKLPGLIQTVAAALEGIGDVGDDVGDKADEND